MAGTVRRLRRHVRRGGRDREGGRRMVSRRVRRGREVKRLALAFVAGAVVGVLVEDANLRGEARHYARGARRT